MEIFIKKIIITCGPTNEKIDEVMEITNMSTGKLGLELAGYFIHGYNVKDENYIPAYVTLIGHKMLSKQAYFNNKLAP